jgi:hypothetical protein
MVNATGPETAAQLRELAVQAASSRARMSSRQPQLVVPTTQAQQALIEQPQQ